MKVELKCPNCGIMNGTINTETGEVHCDFCGADVTEDAFEWTPEVIMEVTR